MIIRNDFSLIHFFYNEKILNYECFSVSRVVWCNGVKSNKYSQTSFVYTYIEKNSFSDMDRVLVNVLGEDCYREIKLFAAEEIDEEAFWALDKGRLVEIGK